MINSLKRPADSVGIPDDNVVKLPDAIGQLLPAEFVASAL
jgi:hypothetical protein